MTTKAAPVRRGRNTPTSVRILFRKRSDGRMSYRIRWIDRLTGKTAAEACGMDNVYARNRREKKRLELRGILSGAIPDHTLTELTKAVPSFKADKSPRTTRVVKTSLEALTRLCGERLLTRVDRAFIMDFRAKRLGEGVSPATVNKPLREIESALPDAFDAGWLKTNPLWRWEGMQVREAEKRIRVVERDEFARPLDAPKASRHRPRNRARLGRMGHDSGRR